MENQMIASSNQAVKPPPQNFLNKVKGVFLSVAAKLKEVIYYLRVPSRGAEAEGEVPSHGISDRTKKIVTGVSAIFFLLIILLIAASYLRNMGEKPAEEVKEEDSLQTTIVERKASRYATDEAVLKMEGDVKALEEDMNKEDLEEKSLPPPNLNFDVNFTE